MQVHPAVWQFQVGGYQVCDKWLKDRRGRTLSNAEIETYRKIVHALSETLRMMDAIDKWLV
ncbi:MAG: type ISP restriction/modification enzyme [Fimbriimonadales bacterium]